MNAKTYQFINVVRGVSHSHKTANIFFSFDSVAWPVNWNVYEMSTRRHYKAIHPKVIYFRER